MEHGGYWVLKISDYITAKRMNDWDDPQRDEEGYTTYYNKVAILQKGTYPCDRKEL